MTENSNSRRYKTGTIQCRGCERDLPQHEYDDWAEKLHSGLCRRCDPVQREHDDRVFAQMKAERIARDEGGNRG